MKIEIEIPDRDVALMERFMEKNQNEEGNSYGPLNMEILAEMLMRDVVLAVRRPGSLVGEQIVDILKAHGYHF